MPFELWMTFDDQLRISKPLKNYIKNYIRGTIDRQPVDNSKRSDAPPGTSSPFFTFTIEPDVCYKIPTTANEKNTVPPKNPFTFKKRPYF
jgi:hypothetical protein